MEGEGQRRINVRTIYGDVMALKAWKDQILAKIFSRSPLLVERWARSAKVVNNLDTPWAILPKESRQCKIALVTTAGVHLRSQAPFDMEDNGDPTWREIPSQADLQDLMITHNYYDHRDADRDINIVFPVKRLSELEADGVIGRIAPRHFSFMGHTGGRHLETMVKKTAPEVAGLLKADEVDTVFLTPA